MKFNQRDLKNFQLQRQFSQQGNGPSQMLGIFKKLGYVQLDSISVVRARSQELVFKSRLVNYQLGDYLSLYKNSAASESYLHALSLLPTDSQLLHYNQLIYQKKFFSAENEGILKKFRANPEAFIDFVLHSADKSKQAWDMSARDQLINLLWRSGYLTVTRDENFNKILTDNSANVPTSSLTTDELLFNKSSELIKLALQNIALASFSDIKNYFNLKKSEMKRPFDKLLADQTIIKVGDLAGEDYYALKNDRLLAENAPSFQTNGTCLFLSPFDNLLRDRKRLLYLFALDYRLESYVPAAKRQYGYFALPILLNDDIIATIDLKADRLKNTLIVKKFTKFPAWKNNYQETVLQALENFKDFVEVEEIDKAALKF